MLFWALNKGICVSCAGILVGTMLVLSGCGSATGLALGVGGGVTATTIVGVRTPTDEIEQTYYLGVYDPQETVTAKHLPRSRPTVNRAFSIEPNSLPGGCTPV